MKLSHYFSHNAKARRNHKIQAMQLIYGSEGYGWFWIIMEILRESTDYKYGLTSKYSFPVLAKELGTTPERAKEFIEDCIKEFLLLSSDGNSFWNDTLIETMNLMEQKSKMAREAVKKRWAKKQNNTNDLHMYDERDTDVIELKEKKRKETKLKEKKVEGKENSLSYPYYLGVTKENSLSSSTCLNVSKDNSLSLPTCLSELLYNLIKKRNHYFDKPDIEEWSHMFNEMINVKQIDPVDIELAIFCIQENDFFKKLIITPQLLLKHWAKIVDEFAIIEVDPESKIVWLNEFRASHVLEETQFKSTCETINKPKIKNNLTQKFSDAEARITPEELNQKEIESFRVS